MADKTWANFLDYVLPYANGVSRGLAEIMVKQSCIDFLENTLALRSTIDTITLVASTAEYNVTFASEGIGASGQYEAVAFVPGSVKIVASNSPLHETSEDELEQKVWDWRNLYTSSNPTHYFLTWDHKMYTHPYPSSGYSGSTTITGECYIKPTEAATGVLDTIWNNYKEYIGYGAAERLLRMPNQRWSDVQGAEYFGLNFRRGKSKVKAEMTRGKTRRPGIVRPPDTFLIA